MLGDMYYKGMGVKKHFEVAATWYTLAAEQGHIEAQYNVGIIYHYGLGTPRNGGTAVKWYTQAAEQGHVNAQYQLGVMFAQGDDVPENDQVAVKWFTLAARLGDTDAQCYLGAMYDDEFGARTITDYLRAYMWYSLAEYNGDMEGAESKEKVAKKMTQAQIAKAQDMSSQCLESNYKDC
jgi:TPR repeat protein